MNRSEKIKAHKKMLDEISNKETDIVEEINVQINNFYKDKKENRDWNTLFTTIKDLMYISLKQSYKTTLQNLNDIYNVGFTIPNKISNKEIDKYTYKKDKKSLSKRISEHLNSAEREQTSKDTLKFYITRLLDNEVLVVNHKLAKKKMKEKGYEYGTIITGHGCGRDCCNVDVEEPIPLDLIEDEPPYHPYCQCDIIFEEEKVELPEKKKK